MQARVLNDIKTDIRLSFLARHLRVGERSQDYETIRGMLDEALSIARPKAIYRAVYVDERGEDFVSLDGVRFRSRLLRVNLDNVHTVFPYVVTCGTELDDWSVKIDGLVEQYWADCMKEMILRSATRHLHDHLRHEFGLRSISTMNPGSLPDWPLSEQRNLFRVLGDVYGSIGVRLSESLLMIPTKSVSGIYFPTETGYENCQLCPRPNCPGRRAPYNGRLCSEELAQT